MANITELRNKIFQKWKKSILGNSISDQNMNLLITIAITEMINNEDTVIKDCPFCVGKTGRISSTCEDCLGSGTIIIKK